MFYINYLTEYAQTGPQGGANQMQTTLALPLFGQPFH